MNNANKLKCIIPIFFLFILYIILIECYHADASQLPVIIGSGTAMNTIKSNENSEWLKNTIIEKIIEKKIEYNVWYCVDTHKININFDLNSQYDPILVGGLAIPVEAEFFLHSNKKDRTVKAFLLRQINPDNVFSVVIYRKISISHWGKPVGFDPIILKKLNIATEIAGTYLFTLDFCDNPVLIQPNDAIFKRKYYRVVVDPQNDNGQCVSYEKVRPLVSRYIIYEYFPNGNMKRSIKIVENGVFAPYQPGKKRIDFFADDRDDYIQYLAYTSDFTESGEQLSGPMIDDKKTIITDPKDSLWLQKILHD